MHAQKIIGSLLSFCILLSSALTGSITSSANSGGAADAVLEPAIGQSDTAAAENTDILSLSTQSAWLLTATAEISGAAWDGQTADTDWWNETDTEFHLTTGAQLAGLSSLVGAGNTFSGKTIYLDNDIDLGGQEWAPIGLITAIDNNAAVTGTAFAGVFDGQEHQIIGLKISVVSGNMGYGLFAYSKGTIQNLGIDGTSVIDLSALTTDLTAVGSVVGFNDGGLVSNCYTEASITDAGNTLTKDPCIGGIAGMNDYNGMIEYCRNTGSITLTKLKARVGGIVGSSVFTRSGQGSSSYIQYCYNAATLSVADCDNLGGIVGFSRVGHIEYCYNVGSITCTTDKKSGANIQVAGIAGVANHNNVSYCYNAGTFSTPNSEAIHGAGGSNSNCYSLTGSATANTSATALSKEDLITAVTALAASDDGVYYVADSQNINNGFPIFTWQAANSGELSITAVTNPAGISAAYGAEVSSLELPNTISVTLNDQTVIDVGVVWNTDVYNPTISGTQTISGTLTLDGSLTNPENLTAAIVVTVGEAPADYTNLNSAVTAATDKIQSGLYTERSTVALQSLIDAVDWDKTDAEQSQVDAMAGAILNATDALIEKSLEIILNISEGMVTQAVEGKYDITWNANITAGDDSSIDNINTNVTFKEYGAYYATSGEVLEDYSNASAEEIRQKIFGSSTDGSDLTVYTMFGFRLKNVPANAQRAAMFYVEYEYQEHTYIILSTIDGTIAVIAE